MKITETQLRKIIQDVIQESPFSGARASGYLAQTSAIGMAIGLAVVVANGIINHYNQLRQMEVVSEFLERSGSIGKDNFNFNVEDDKLYIENTDTAEERILDLRALGREGREELALEILESVYGNAAEAESALNKYIMHSFGGPEAKLIRSILGLDDLSKYSPDDSYDSSNMSVPYESGGDNVGESLQERKLRRIIRSILKESISQASGQNISALPMDGITESLDMSNFLNLSRFGIGYGIDDNDVRIANRAQLSAQMIKMLQEKLFLDTSLADAEQKNYLYSINYSGLNPMLALYSSGSKNIFITAHPREVEKFSSSNEVPISNGSTLDNVNTGNNLLHFRGDVKFDEFMSEYEHIENYY